MYDLLQSVVSLDSDISRKSAWASNRLKQTVNV